MTVQREYTNYIGHGLQEIKMNQEIIEMFKEFLWLSLVMY